MAILWLEKNSLEKIPRKKKPKVDSEPLAITKGHVWQEISTCRDHTPLPTEADASVIKGSAFGIIIPPWRLVLILYSLLVSCKMLSSFRVQFLTGTKINNKYNKSIL